MRRRKPSYNTRKQSTRSPLGNERGSALIMVTVAIVAMFSFAVLAVECSILMTARVQLHAAADAAALAGASGLIIGDQATAIDRAISFASYNSAVQDTMRPVIITAADISFPQPDIIRVETHRTVATGDPIKSYFLRVIDPSDNLTANMTAVAAARVYDVCGSDCLKPWAIPDRWEDVNGDGAWDEGDFYDPATTGYRAPDDIGETIVLKVGNPSQAISPGLFFPINFPPLNNDLGMDPLVGAAWYELWIGECSPYLVSIGDSLQVEPGNMVGPTIQGMDALIDLDPGAYWDPVGQTVVGSAFGKSPRIGLVPFFDPTLPPESGRTSVTVTKIGAVFIEGTGPGSRVTARFLQVSSAGVACEGGLGAGLVKGITLIE